MSMAIDEIIKMKDKDVTNQMYLTLHFTFIFLKCMNLFSMPFAKHMCKYFCIS